jgi:hypothetical protein
MEKQNSKIRHGITLKSYWKKLVDHYDLIPYELVKLNVLMIIQV